MESFEMIVGNMDIFFVSVKILGNVLLGLFGIIALLCAVLPALPMAIQRAGKDAMDKMPKAVKRIGIAIGAIFLILYVVADTREQFGKFKSEHSVSRVQLKSDAQVVAKHLHIMADKFDRPNASREALSDQWVGFNFGELYQIQERLDGAGQNIDKID